MVLLMNEGTAHAVDFTQGVPFGGTYVINTRRGPEACARHFGLAGRVLTIPGDDIGHEHLKAPIGNVSAYVAMSEAIGGFAREDVVEVFLSMLRKRHVPDMVVERNRKALEASFAALSSGNFAMQSHEGPARPEFPGYGDLPVGAQTQLRLSAANRTAFFAPSGFRLKFEDPTGACNGCAHCITNCPEGIIRFDPDPEQGLRVTGADVSTFCKLCQECIAVCPEKLFTSAPYEERWQEEEVEAS
jgi:ferredoxin